MSTTIKRNDAGEIIAFMQGATFTANDRPYKLVEDTFVFTCDDPLFSEQFEDIFEVTVYAQDAQTAFGFFAENYRLEMLPDLRMQLKTVNYEDIDTAQFQQ